MKHVFMVQVVLTYINAPLPEADYEVVRNVHSRYKVLKLNRKLWYEMTGDDLHTDSCKLLR